MFLILFSCILSNITTLGWIQFVSVGVIRFKVYSCKVKLSVCVSCLDWPVCQARRPLPPRQSNHVPPNGGGKPQGVARHGCIGKQVGHLGETGGFCVGNRWILWGKQVDSVG